MENCKLRIFLGRLKNDGDFFIDDWIDDLDIVFLVCGRIDV